MLTKTLKAAHWTTKPNILPSRNRSTPPVQFAIVKTFDFVPSNFPGSFRQRMQQHDYTTLHFHRIRTIIESGLLQHWIKQFTPEKVKTCDKSLAQLGNRASRLRDTAGVFVALGTGLSLATLVFFFEIVFMEVTKVLKPNDSEKTENLHSETSVSICRVLSGVWGRFCQVDNIRCTRKQKKPWNTATSEQDCAQKWLVAHVCQWKLNLPMLSFSFEQWAKIAYFKHPRMVCSSPHRSTPGFRRIAFTTPIPWSAHPAEPTVLPRDNSNSQSVIALTGVTLFLDELMQVLSQCMVFHHFAAAFDISNGLKEHHFWMS